MGSGDQKPKQEEELWRTYKTDYFETRTIECV